MPEWWSKAIYNVAIGTKTEVNKNKEEEIEKPEQRYMSQEKHDYVIEKFVT